MGDMIGGGSSERAAHQPALVFWPLPEASRLSQREVRLPRLSLIFNLTEASVWPPAVTVTSQVRNHRCNFYKAASRWLAQGAIHCNYQHL